MAEVKHFNSSNSKKRLDIDWSLIFPTDDSVDDRPPEIVITPADKSKGRGGDQQKPEMEVEDIEYQIKTDGELEAMIPRIRNAIKTLGPKLPDNGEKHRKTLRRCLAEVERRKRIGVKKGGTTTTTNRSKVTLQLSDDSDDGTLCGKKNSNQKSSASSDFGTLFSKKINNSRTVDAFKDEISFFKQERKKQNGEIPCKGQSSIRTKQFKCATTLKKDNKKQRVSNADKKGTLSAFYSPKAQHVPEKQKQPSRKLKAKNASPYHLVDEEPFSEVFDDRAHTPPKKLRQKDISAYCVVDEDPLEEEIDDWAPDSPSSRKSKPRHLSDYHLVDEDPIAEKLDDCMKDIIVYYPSRDDQNSVEVIYRDMACLAPQQYLSSSIMNFYIRYLQQMTSSESIIGNFHFFNTYFYNMLQKLSYKGDSFVKFRKWWKGVNIFTKSYILIPVHDRAHWSLGIICIPSKEDELGPIVLHLDSLGLHDSKSILHDITSFVKEEWKYLKNSEENSNLPITDEIWEDLDRKMHDKRVLVPQQRNDYDCGLFVLYYMERFIKEAPKRFKEEDLYMFSKQWFRPKEASDLRVKIHNLLVQEFKNAKEKETILSPKS